MVYVIIFAGGIGSRMGSDVPKQFLEINDKPILMHTVDVFEHCDKVDKILIVSKSGFIELTKSLVAKYNISKVVDVVPGGKTAFESQFIGISRISNISKDKNDIILVHDGVRPFINNNLIEKCINGVKEKGSAITSSHAFETIALLRENGQIDKTIPRQNCMIARAPQGFYVKDLLAAHLQAKKDNKEYIDSASMMLDQGKILNPIIGPNENIKITTMYDYQIAKLLIGVKNE